MKRSSLRRLIIYMVFSFVFPTFFPASVLAVDEYMVDGMWPALEQPWYFRYPSGIAIDADANVYITDTDNYRIQKFSPSGALITRWGRKGVENGEFDSPQGIAIDGAGSVYVADTQNHRIQKFSSSGEFIMKWGSEGEGIGEFLNPQDIKVDAGGNVYVADAGNDRIQKFNSSGAFIDKWGSKGKAYGEFNDPHGLEIDKSGNVYVVDRINHRIQKFTSSGNFITEWGSKGEAAGEFKFPRRIATDEAGNVYVSDVENHRIQKFTSSGAFIMKWGSGGVNDGEFDWPVGIAVDLSGKIYVVDSDNYRIQKFTLSGDFIAKWSSEGSGSGELRWPKGVVIDSSGNVYIADCGNYRIQKYNPSGEFILQWGRKGTGNGEFGDFYGSFSGGLAIDSSGNVYVADKYNDRIQKFTSSGIFLNKWGIDGHGEGEFFWPDDLAIDDEGYVYVTDEQNNRIQKFNGAGAFVMEWGNTGSGDGEFIWPDGIALDNSGNVYVSDVGNHRIQKFTSSGIFIKKWGEEGSADGQFIRPHGIAVDSAGNVYVSGSELNRIQKFTADGIFISKFGSHGTDPGLLNNPRHLDITSSGRIYVSDYMNNRVQIFAPLTATTFRKAIIVAGSGPYENNDLWDATQLCINHAYHALTYQGYGKDTIQYLSADTDLDLNNDGTPDVDADATNANLEFAVKNWAKGADNLLIYMVGHGGEGTFRMREFELLNASDFDDWLDAVQQTIPGFVAIVYDACSSGSFLDYLIPDAGKTRVLATSASSDERAAFLATGATSFGYQFFSRLFDGGSFYESFLQGKKCMEVTLGSEQNAQIEANGNAAPNEKADNDAAAAIKVGTETAYADDMPAIESVSSPQVLNEGETSAAIYAQNVIDADGIQEVFAVIKPPNYSSGSSDNPVTDLPTINLAAVGNNSYSGMYNGFTVRGVYNVAIFARDGKGVLSLPYQTSVTVPTTTDCLAVASDLSIRVPCAEYNGNPFSFSLDFYHSPDDPSGYYWKMVMSTLTTGSGSECISIGTDLSMPMDCVSYNGTQYGFTLKFYSNPYDPSGYYWKMDMSTLVVR
jgi:DNA-binding beta-propeller fold protein YncE